MKELYAKDGKIYANQYLEIYVPIDYFTGKIAQDRGISIVTLGLLYIRSYTGGKEGPLQLLNIPTIIEVMVYDTEIDEIKIEGKSIQVRVLKYMKDSYIFLQYIPKGREIAEVFMNSILSGKLPKTLDYAKIIDIWWKNLEVAGVNFQVPSKILEMIVANIYRSPNDPKLRFGEYYGKQSTPNGYNYTTGNVRDVVEGMSTFSGMVFEDISRMITSGINSSMEGEEEPISPLEKIIYY